MKRYLWLILGITGCLIVAAVGYFWTTALIDSVFSFRSPLRDSAPPAGPALGNPLSRRVVIVLIDALRTDTADNLTVMPYLNQLRNSAAYTTIRSQPPSFSEPGYTTILTGAWPDINDGPSINLDYEKIPTFTQDDIFSDAHRSGLPTAISGYYWFQKLLPTQSVEASFYTSGEDAKADEQVMGAALPMLAGKYRLVLIHLDQVDYAGHHLGGPYYPAWNEAATRVDNDLKQIVAQLDPQWDTVIVLSDHGQIDRGGHGGPEPIVLVEPFVMAGAGVRPGNYPDIQQVDIAPTVAALLGVSLPASSEGTVPTKMLALTPDQITRIEAAESAQKSRLLAAYETAIHSQPAGQPDPAMPISYDIAMNSARADRLTRERVGRNITALILALLPAGILILRGAKKDLWLFAGALLYVLLFNFRYAVLDGRTYSLSSVESQTWLISYTAITAAGSLVIAWLLTMVFLRAFREGPRQAARTSLGLVFAIVYLLSLPILVSYAVNGIVITWTLPEFYTLYLAVQSLIQWIFVALTGLLLTGVAALIGRLVPQPVKKSKRSRR